jgi:hypothetical protein
VHHFHIYWRTLCPALFPINKNQPAAQQADFYLGVNLSKKLSFSKGAG